MKSINTSLLEIFIPSENEPVSISDLSDHTLRSICHGWWASMNVGWMRFTAWNNSQHASWWWFYLHYGIEETAALALYVSFDIKFFTISQNMGLAQWGNNW